MTTPLEMKDTPLQRRAVAAIGRPPKKNPPAMKIIADGSEVQSL
jgi:hypothetical protein